MFLLSSQLFYDGYKDQAVSLAQVIKPFPACPPSDRLFSIFRAGYKIEEGISLENFLTSIIIFMSLTVALSKPLVCKVGVSVGTFFFSFFFLPKCTTKDSDFLFYRLINKTTKRASHTFLDFLVGLHQLFHLLMIPMFTPSLQY